MISSEESFWNIAGRWERLHPSIRIECTQQPWEVSFTGVVISVDRPSISFRDVDTGEERTMDFQGAVIRFAIFEPIEAVCAFAAIFEDEGEPRSAECLLTELRDFGKPS